MPKIRANEIDIYYEIHGTGEPLVLISGLNSDHTLYRGMLPQLAARYQVIVFDNRGVGQTDKPDIPYSIEMMAEDTSGLLTALGIEQAHILGASMGGRIAAALAFAHPQLVRSLVLISTVMTTKGMRRTLMQRLTPLQLRIPMIRGPHPYYASMRQLQASRSFDCMDRLSEIQVPTLILHGEKDKHAPYPLAQAMHAGIKNSHMLTFSGGHIFFLFQPKACIEAITAFLP